MKHNKSKRAHDTGCQALDSATTRREFLGRTSCLAFAAVFAGLGPLSTISGTLKGAECSFPIPGSDGVSIDSANQVILVRNLNRVYAFALACPHENTALRWRPQDGRFQCPRHESKYQTDGTFISGRATRNMDRFAVRLDGAKVVVDLDRLFRSNQQQPEWQSAFVAL